MSKIAFIDHSYHKKTNSSSFLLEILQSFGHDVDHFWDDFWQGGEQTSLKKVQNYDAIILFQISPQWHGAYCNLHNNITYVPMLDSYGYTLARNKNSIGPWVKFSNVKILNFSSTLHYICNAFGFVSRYFKYFQQPMPSVCVPQNGLHGFFWARREDQISVDTIFRLIGDTRFDSLHIHLACDPFSPEPKLPSEYVLKKHHVTVSHWFEAKQDFMNVLKNANIVFAPRLEEGIGQAMLEAFAYGQCVIAPNCGTMNEYITDGLTGLLFDYNNPKQMDFSNVVELGKRSHAMAMRGYSAWIACKRDIVDYILQPCRELYEDKRQNILWESIKGLPCLANKEAPLGFIWKMLREGKDKMKKIIQQ